MLDFWIWWIWPVGISWRSWISQLLVVRRPLLHWSKLSFFKSIAQKSLKHSIYHKKSQILNFSDEFCKNLLELEELDLALFNDKFIRKITTLFHALDPAFQLNRDSQFLNFPAPNFWKFSNFCQIFHVFTRRVTKTEWDGDVIGLVAFMIIPLSRAQVDTSTNPVYVHEYMNESSLIFAVFLSILTTFSKADKFRGALNKS